MTQELLHFNKTREHSVDTSEVLRRLNESLKLKTDPIKAILYARDYYDKPNFKGHHHIFKVVTLDHNYRTIRMKF